jgi:hypothetical protein
LSPAGGTREDFLAGAKAPAFLRLWGFLGEAEGQSLIYRDVYFFMFIARNMQEKAQKVMKP